MAHPRTTTFHFTLSLPPSLSSFFSAFSKKTSSRKIPSLRRRLSSRTQEERYPRYPDKREQRGGEEAKGSEERRWREPNLGFAPYSIATETALSHQLEKSLSARKEISIFRFFSSSPPISLPLVQTLANLLAEKGFACVLDYTLSSYVYSSPFSRNLFRNWI